MSFHERRLPHWYPEGEPLFLTWSLHGAIPHGIYPPPGKESAGQAFVWLDRYLDTRRTGPMFLRNWRVAEIVRNSLFRGQELGQYALHHWVIMPNHVHVLLTSRIHPTRMLNSLKGTTAREANRILRRTGEPFWQGECYDRWVRDDDEFCRIARYIANNPVRAGLAGEPAEYRWSDCYERAEESARGGEESPRHGSR